MFGVDTPEVRTQEQRRFSRSDRRARGPRVESLRGDGKWKRVVARTIASYGTKDGVGEIWSNLIMRRLGGAWSDVPVSRSSLSVRDTPTAFIATLPSRYTRGRYSIRTNFTTGSAPMIHS